MTMLILHVEIPPAFSQEGYYNTASALLDKYDVSEKGGGGINVWLSLDELEKLKIGIDQIYEGTKDLRNK